MLGRSCWRWRRRPGAVVSPQIRPLPVHGCVGGGGGGLEEVDSCHPFWVARLGFARPACAAASCCFLAGGGEVWVLPPAEDFVSLLPSVSRRCCSGAGVGRGRSCSGALAGVRRPSVRDDGWLSAAALWSGGDGVGDLRARVLSELGLWMVAGGSVSLLRFRRLDTADLQSVEHGEVPRPTSHKDSVSLLCSEPFNRLTKLFQRWCFGGLGVFGCSSFPPPAVLRQRRWSATSVVNVVCIGFQGLDCNFVFWGVVCAMFRGHLCFWVLLVSTACVCSVCLDL